MHYCGESYDYIILYQVRILLLLVNILQAKCLKLLFYRVISLWITVMQ